MMAATPASPGSAGAPRLVVLGQGYVGLPLAMRAVEVGFDVVGFDPDKRKISTLNSGRAHVDDVTDDDLEAAFATGRYLATEVEDHLDDFDVAVMAVPTPLRDGVPDITHIESAARTVGRRLSPGALVVLESTTFPGTTEEVVGPILEVESGLRAGPDFALGYSPERIDPGNQQWDFRRTPKVVSGIDEASREAVAAFYGRLVDTVVPVSGTMEAELTKLLENTFRHVNIALVNELAIHARLLGIDIWEVVEAAGTKPFGFMPFRPGPGVGGHCLPVDPTFLSWRIERRLGTPSRFIRAANEVNTEMPTYVVGRIQAALNERRKPVNGSGSWCWGWPTSRTRTTRGRPRSTGWSVACSTWGPGSRSTTATSIDPELPDGVELVDLTAERLAAADAVVVLTDHDEVDYELVAANAGYVFDTRNRLAAGPTVEVL